MTPSAGMGSGRLVQADLLRSGVDVLLDAEVMDVEKPDDTGAVPSCVRACVPARSLARWWQLRCLWVVALEPLPCALLACAQACLPGALARGHKCEVRGRIVMAWRCGMALRRRALWVAERVRAIWRVAV